jgi:hypothetical protein
MTESDAKKVLTLYEKNPDIWENIIKAGYQNIGELSKFMRRAVELDRALGASNVTGNWINGRTHPTIPMEERASAYIKSGYKTPPPAEKKVADEPAAPVVQESVGVVLIVTVPEEKVGNVKRLLKTMGCDVIDA